MRRSIRLQNGRLSPQLPKEDGSPENWTHDGNAFCSRLSLSGDIRVVSRTAKNQATHRRNRGEVFWLGRALAKAFDSEMRGFSRTAPQDLSPESFQVPSTYVRLTSVFHAHFTPHQIAVIFQNMLDFMLVLSRIGMVHGHLRPQTIWINPGTFELIFADWSYALEMEGPNLAFPKYKVLPTSEQDWYPAYFHPGRRAAPGLDHFAAANILLGLAARLWPDDDAEILPKDMHAVLDDCLSDELGATRFSVDEYVSRWRCPLLYYFDGVPNPLTYPWIHRSPKSNYPS